LAKREKRCEKERKREAYRAKEKRRALMKELFLFLKI